MFGWNQEVIDYEGEGHGQVTVTIVAGDTGATIGQTLATNGVVKTAEAFVAEVSITKPEPSFFPGTYQLKQEMSAAAALTALQDPANKIEMKAVIPEGTQMSQIFATLEAVTGIPNADFVAAAADPTLYGVPATAPSLEGWLFPATYELSDTDTATTIIQKLVDRTIQSLDAAGVPEAERENVLIIASIIQREARHTDDFYKVSRVIQNRLDQGIKLGMDSTVKYGLSDDASSVWSSDAQLTDDNPWNTYVHTGLPIGPISNPGDLAIDAAMNPTPGDWLFFVTVNQDTGETLFSTTNAEHEELVAQAKQWCSDNPDNPAC
nr:endolytic transglycosylase MltG [Lysinibacter cavernae]